MRYSLNIKLLIYIITILILSNFIILYKAIKYRNIIIRRNKGYESLSYISEYKNSNYANKLFKEHPEYHDNFLIFIGASNIQRWDFEKNFPNKPFINRGIGDNTSTMIVERFEDDVLNLKPSIVVITMPSNDVKNNIPAEQSKANLFNMVGRATEKNIIPIILGGLPVVYDLNPSLIYSHPENEMLDMEHKMLDVCRQSNIRYINLREIFSNRNDIKDLFFQDGIHLNEEGYNILSKIILEALKNYNLGNNID